MIYGIAGNVCNLACSTLSLGRRHQWIEIRELCTWITHYLCFVMGSQCPNFHKSVMVASPEMKQSDWPIASETTLKNMDKCITRIHEELLYISMTRRGAKTNPKLVLASRDSYYALHCFQIDFILSCDCIRFKSVNSRNTIVFCEHNTEIFIHVCVCVCVCVCMYVHCCFWLFHILMPYNIIL